eukprot:CAMPEP_0174851228 /NCGR_PEP_ID=MMETSP1114-20130205/22412_1 /TAXON_ID=312471 /ORGANISM="Neobodo designis, Strain CCAP 1951/1" /LENGTH=315 /DNA_ID=CAMNT_0016085749 /DNA_START=131 /DNA_END=1078 /DNA_ORIENTATION=+
MNRLRKIRQTCGANDEDNDGKEGSGDPFKDKITAFMNAAKELREQIMERNEEAQKGHKTSTEIAVMSRDINAEMRTLKADVKAMEALAEAAVRDVMRTNKKIAKAGQTTDARADKLKIRERVAQEREKAVASAKEVIESLEELNQQRYLSAKEAKQINDQSPADKRKTLQQSHLRQTLAQRLKAQNRRAAQGGGADDGDGAPSKRLEDDPETAQEMKSLAEKKKREDAALDRIHAGLGRITECAIQIGQELDTQDRMLQDAEDKMDKANKDLKAINKSLTGLLKAQHPMNMIINVSCFLLILALVGFFLSEFGVV